MVDTLGIGRGVAGADRDCCGGAAVRPWLMWVIWAGSLMACWIAVEVWM